MIDQIITLFNEHGQGLYFGEQVTETEHALQCAYLAEQAGASPKLVAAALLHDIGHLVAVVDVGPRGDLAVDDDRHEAVGALDHLLEQLLVDAEELLGSRGVVEIGRVLPDHREARPTRLIALPDDGPPIDRHDIEVGLR